MNIQRVYIISPEKYESNMIIYGGERMAIIEMHANACSSAASPPHQSVYPVYVDAMTMAHGQNTSKYRDRERERG